MTMKKRFLGLAMAAMVALPATTAYANTIQGSENSPLNHSVTVSGSVRNEAGVAPEGIIEVELPTSMQFQVDQEGVFTGSQFTVTNKSKSNIDVSVASFSETNPNGGIKLLPMDDSTFEQKTRDYVGLQLSGNVNNTVDLANFGKSSSANNKLLTVNGDNGVGIITLDGKAGKSKGSESSRTKSEVEQNGIKEDFSLVFQIKKSTGK